MGDSNRNVTNPRETDRESIAARISRVLALLSAGCLLAVPVIIAVCYAMGDVPAVLHHRRKFQPVFTVYEMTCICCLYLAVALSFFALICLPLWRRFALLAACFAGFYIFEFWMNSLRGHW
jgi:hypothetical protein